MTALLLPAIAFAVTTIGTNITTGGHITPVSNNASDLGGATAWRNIYASTSILVTGASYFYATSTYTGTGADLVVAGVSTSTLAGQLTIAGNTILGNATTDTINVTGRISTSVLPSISNEVDLGSFARPWRNIYASTSVLVGGAAGASTTISSSGNITISGSILPSASVSNLGASSTPWQKIYASSSIVLGRNDATTTLNIASNTASAGKGTCIPLRATDGTLLYLSASSTTSAATDAAPWSVLVVSTVSCE